MRYVESDKGSYEKHKNEIVHNSQKADIYISWCNSIKSQYESDKIDNADHNCAIIMAYLNYIAPYRKSIYDDSRCRYLYYWIYHSLLKNNKNYDVAFNWYSIILTGYFHMDSDDPHACRNYKEESEKIILEKSAKLIELYETFNNDNKAFTCDCAKKCSELYIKYVQECPNDNDYDFCRKLEDFKNKYEGRMVSFAKCTDVPNKLPPALKNNIHIVIIIPMITLTALSFFLFALYKVKLFYLSINNKNYIYYHIFYKNYNYKHYTFMVHIIYLNNSLLQLDHE
ncbi:hypothetical protein PCYB_004800 [Plasmodium cynomolgi strain B]|uniref:CYIR protein n=1 Tax=Plasmodium cynomolgi (strain B) TaxID=1120755 RepID=K6UF99_PLACD|nr:hypothetical protein PCYB_004800 [Plasmodium cynomolgi strain B]GAB69731.1 hypothetical protein PCYB_004800 [Plasmodium cynomolgi strain B]